MYIFQPCVTLSTLSSSERYSCVVNLGLFLFLFLFRVLFFFPFCSVRWGFFPHPPTPPLLLFMKLENLKDCCVFVNNKTIVHSVLVNVPCPNCYFWSPSAQGCGLFLMFPPPPPPPRPPGVNARDQTPSPTPPGARHFKRKLPTWSG